MLFVIVSISPVPKLEPGPVSYFHVPVFRPVPAVPVKSSLHVVVKPAGGPGTAFGLTAAAHILRNRRSREALTVGVIVLVALTHISWKVLARIVSDLIAWDNARPADLGNQLHR